MDLVSAKKIIERKPGPRGVEQTAAARSSARSRITTGMTSMWERHVKIDDIESQPWQNGRGSTREVFSYAASEALTPGSPRWRLSVAELSTTSEFSPFPSRLRTFIPVGGDCELIIDGVHHHVPEARPLVFSGDSVTSLIGLSTPCHAVNLISQRDGSQVVTLRSAAPDDPEFARAPVRIALKHGTGTNALDVFSGSPTADAHDVALWALVCVVEDRPSRNRSETSS